MGSASAAAIALGCPVAFLLGGCAQIAGVDFDAYGARSEAPSGSAAGGAGAAGPASGSNAVSGNTASVGSGAASSAGSGGGSGGFCGISCAPRGSGGAQTLVTGFTAPLDITGMDGAQTGVYIAIDADASKCGGILHVQIDPCNLSWATEPIDHPVSLAVMNDRVFFTTAGGDIRSVPLSGPPSVVHYQGEQQPRAIRPGVVDIYWATQTAVRLSSADYPTTGQPCDLVTGLPFPPVTLGPVDQPKPAKFFFADDHASLGEGNGDCGSTAHMETGPVAHAVGGDEYQFFIVRSAANEVDWCTPTAGSMYPTCPYTPIAQNQAMPTGLAVNGNAYWTNYGDGTVMGCNPLYSCPPTAPIATNQKQPTAIASDSSKVYWFNSGSGELWYAPVPP